MPNNELVSQPARNGDANRHLNEACDDDEVHKGSWHHVTRFLWSGPSYFRMNRSLNTLYPGNEHLFRDVLGLTKVNLSHFVAEAYSFCLNDPTLSRPLEYMLNVITALDSYMSSPSYRTSSEYAARSVYHQELRSLKIWPVLTDPDEPPTQLRTAANSDEWFIADRWDLHETFYGTLPLLAFSPDKNLNMTTVFVNLNLMSRYLSSAAVATTTFEGRIKRSPQYCERIRTKVPFFIR